MASFNKLNEHLQKEVVKIMAKLNKSHVKRRAELGQVKAKLKEIKDLHEDCSKFKTSALAKIEADTKEFRQSKTHEMDQIRESLEEDRRLKEQAANAEKKALQDKLAQLDEQYK